MSELSSPAFSGFSQTAADLRYLQLSGGTLTGALQFTGTGHAGLRLNNLTTTQRDAIASPAAGMAVWNTTTARLNVHDGSGWTGGFVRLAGNETLTGSLTISPSAANTGVFTANGTVSGGGGSRGALLTISDNWSATTGGTAGPRVMDIDLTTAGGAPNFGLTQIMRVRRDGTNVWTMDHGGSHNFGNGGAFIDTNNGKIQVASNWNFTIAGDVSLYRRAANHLGLGFSSAAPSAQTMSGSDGSGTNIVAGKLCLGPGRSTGSATPAVLALQGTAAGSSGTGVQTLVDVLTIVRAGIVRLTGLPTSASGLSTGDLWNDAGTLKIA